MATLKAIPFSEQVSDGRLTFELIHLPHSRAVGIVRTLTTAAGAYEQHLVFECSELFCEWIDSDDYRHQAQALFARIRRKFGELLDVMEHRDDHAP